MTVLFDVTWAEFVTRMIKQNSAIHRRSALCDKHAGEVAKARQNLQHPMVLLSSGPTRWWLPDT